jgi:hypothetical protein
MATMDDFNRRRSFSENADLEGDDFDTPKDRRDKEAAKEAAKTAYKEKLDDKLDKALEESFPGSDPISIVQPPQSTYDKSKH